MRKLVIGDIHGGLKAILEIIEKVNPDENDQFIFLGDYVDGWSESPETLDYLINFKTKFKCVFIKGNHDDLLLNYLKTGQFNKEWLIHGGQSTIDAYQNISSEKIKIHIKFLESLENYYIDEYNRLFIHAGFTNLKGVKHEYFNEMFYWDRTLWETALAVNNQIAFESAEYPSRFKLYTEIYIGHTPVTKINETKPINRACVWNIDTGAAFKGPLTILDVETKEYWQSKPLYILYPDEVGRN